MENITTGHWIFAGVFAITFLIYLFISYRKDLALHKIHYRSGGIQVALLIVITLFVLFVFKRHIIPRNSLNFFQSIIKLELQVHG